MSTLSFWTASDRGASPAAGSAEDADTEVRMCGGRRWRAREKSGEGNTVKALTRTLVMTSSFVRWGLNWYLKRRRNGQSWISSEFFPWTLEGRKHHSDRANKNFKG